MTDPEWLNRQGQMPLTPQPEELMISGVMVKCPECGGEYQERPPQCPYCGYCFQGG